MNTEIILKIQSAIVASNIDDVAASVRAEVAKVNTDLKTDEDFATAEQQVKDFKAAEDAIKEARDAALSEAQDVRKLLDTTDEIIALLAQTRLALDKQVKAQKAKVKEEITSRTRDGIHKALAGCDARLQAAMRKVLRIDELDGVLLPDWRRAAPKSWRTGRHSSAKPKRICKRAMHKFRPTACTCLPTLTTC